ncbi:MAG: prepilin peptidase [Candidatus Gracilibacteria bacterium]|nr:prepilin peptidase [Candidatus Gracilibacteria bacterium]
MQIFFYTCLFTYGLLFGSFSSVLIHRFKSEEKGIWSGRSHCPKCNTTLRYFDLIPIFSYLSTLGKCRYCKTKISPIYPILELSTAVLFMLIGYFLIDINLLFIGTFSEILKLIFWLSIGFITILYIFYDILFLEIHEGIMLSGISLAFLGLVSNATYIYLVPTIKATSELYAVENLISIPLGLSIIGLLYLIMLKELKLIYDFLIISIIVLSLVILKYVFLINLSDLPVISGIIGAFSIFIFFFLQIVLSGGRALGGGDLRIGVMIGLLLGISYSFAGMMITYFVGSIISILLIIYQKIRYKNKETLNVVPFGPFLGVGFLITLLFQNQISNIIEIYF